MPHSTHNKGSFICSFSSGERHCCHDEYPPRHDAFSTTHDGSRSRPDELTDNPGADNDVRELPENLRKNRSPLSSQA